jgi:hypothetical protein
MTFKLFNALNEVFKEHKEVHLRNYAPTDELKDYGTIGRYNEDSDIEEINLDMKTYPHAKLYVFDGDFHEELKY